MKSTVWAALLGCLFIISSLSCQESEDPIVNTKEALEEVLKSEVEDNGLVSISYCVVKNDQLLHTGAKGFADESNGKLATDSTRYLVASISKTITAVAILQLVEQGLVGLDADINDYLPFPVRNPNYPDDKITLRMLLGHTSSISDEFQENFELDCYGTDCSMSLEQYFKAVFLETGQYYSPGNFSDNQPGTAEDYSNLGSALIGYLLENIAQVPFDVYCKNNIFIPLGMDKTAWRLADVPLAELAIPYSDEITSANPHYTFPDYPNGGLRTTVLDLSRFLRMVMLNGGFEGAQLLSPETMAEMKTLQFGSEEQCLSFYFDTIDGRRVLGHSGGEKGVTSEMFYDPSTNIGVIVFSNVEDADLENVISLLFRYGEDQ